MKCADMTNDQCWEILVVKADAGGWRRQSVFTDQLFCQTQDARVGKEGEKLKISSEELHSKCWD